MLQDIYECAEKALAELYQEAGHLENEQTEHSNKKKSMREGSGEKKIYLLARW